MNVTGYMTKEGRWWHVDIPALDIATQGKNRKDALFMATDAANLMAEANGIDVRYTATPGAGDHFVMIPDNIGPSVAFVLKRQRGAAKLTLAQVADRLGYRTVNGYAAYEQGRRTPSIEKMSAMLEAISSRHMAISVE